MHAQDVFLSDAEFRESTLPGVQCFSPRSSPGPGGGSAGELAGLDIPELAHMLLAAGR